MVIVMAYVILNILLSAFAGKRQWKLTAAVHGAMLAAVLVLLAAYTLSESAADLVTALTGKEANAIRAALDAIGGTLTLAPIVVVEILLLVQAVFSGLFAAVMAVTYMKRKLAWRARYVSLAQNRTERNTEEQTVRVPIRCLWQRNGVMNC